MRLHMEASNECAFLLPDLFEASVTQNDPLIAHCTKLRIPVSTPHCGPDDRGCRCSPGIRLTGPESDDGNSFELARHCTRNGFDVWDGLSGSVDLALI